MLDRDYILKRIKSRSISQDEFNYDKLMAPPLMSLFTPMDIANLNQIARSIKLSAKLPEKYKMIDDIMRARGFKKLISGTNRIAYEFVEDNNFIVKVALDAIGIKDNPNEFKNQFLFKPFVTKVFEVSPCGTVGLFERVSPITNREEFIAVADDIYTVINDVFIGEYILADFGTNFFMNWGIREGFGPVLLDYAMVYKLDGKKLYCNELDPTTDSGRCEGVIDYDPGYNFLVCTKCGRQYKAKDLAFDGETRKIIVKESGGTTMDIKISRGNSVSKTVKVGNNGSIEEVKKMPNKEIRVESAPREQKKPEPQPIDTKADETKTVEKKIEVPAKENTMAVNGVTVKPAAKEPISFATEEEMMNVSAKIADHINEIRSLAGLITDDNDYSALIDMVLDLLSELEFRNVTDQNLSIFVKNAEKIALIFDKMDEATKAKALNNEFINEIIDAANASKKTEVVEEVAEEIEEVEEDEDDDDEYGSFSGFCEVTGSLKNLKDIDPSLESKKVIVLTDEASNYILSSDRSILTLGSIDGRSIDSISIVSKSWLDNVQRELESNDTVDDIEDDAEDANIETVTGEEVPAAEE